MSCRVVFTDTARADLREIAFSIADLTGDKSRAAAFVRDIQAQTKMLERFPESGAIPRDSVLKSSGYRFLSHKNHLLFYRYEKQENTVYVMAVFGAKRDYTRVMKKYL